MNRIPVTDHFFLDEFIDPYTYSKRGARSIELLDMRLVMGVEFLRTEAGDEHPFTINNWATAKPGQKVYKESGSRRFDTKTGAVWSMHKFFRGFDVKVAGMTPKEFHAFIKEREEYLIKNQFITTLENVAFTTTWTHMDCRYTGLDHLLIVNP
ncbi:MAG: hypothetical protein ACKVOK_01355 [Flavobacteriales bacterium]